MIKITGDKMQLHSERLILRQVRSSDLNDLFRIYGDPATNRFNPAGPHPDINHSHAVLEGWLEHWQTHGFGNWAVSRADRPDEIIGFGGVRIVHYDTFTINNLGYRLAVEAWGQGYATEFASTALRYGFDTLKLDDVSAVVRKNHTASQKVLTKCGLEFVREVHDVKDAPPSLLYTLTRNRYRIEGQ